MKEALRKADELHEFEIEKYREVIETLSAENARYREALERIKQFTMSQFMGANDMALECKIVARKALKGE